MVPIKSEWPERRGRGLESPTPSRLGNEKGYLPCCVDVQADFLQVSLTPLPSTNPSVVITETAIQRHPPPGPDSMFLPFLVLLADTTQ